MTDDSETQKAIKYRRGTVRCVCSWVISILLDGRKTHILTCNKCGANFEIILPEKMRARGYST